MRVYNFIFNYLICSIYSFSPVTRFPQRFCFLVNFVIRNLIFRHPITTIELLINITKILYSLFYLRPAHPRSIYVLLWLYFIGFNKLSGILFFCILFSSSFFRKRKKSKWERSIFITVNAPNRI